MPDKSQWKEYNPRLPIALVAEFDRETMGHREDNIAAALRIFMRLPAALQKEAARTVLCQSDEGPDFWAEVHRAIAAAVMGVLARRAEAAASYDAGAPGHTPGPPHTTPHGHSDA